MRSVLLILWMFVCGVTAQSGDNKISGTVGDAAALVQQVIGSNGANAAAAIVPLLQAIKQTSNVKIDIDSSILQRALQGDVKALLQVFSQALPLIMSQALANFHGSDSQLQIVNKAIDLVQEMANIDSLGQQVISSSPSLVKSFQTAAVSVSSLTSQFFSTLPHTLEMSISSVVNGDMTEAELTAIAANILPGEQVKALLDMVTVAKDIKIVQSISQLGDSRTSGLLDDILKKLNEVHSLIPAKPNT